MDITKEAKEIFGNIVTRAKSEYGTKKKTYSFEKDFDGDTIVIEFNNGKIVEISNSEWGTIRNLKSY